MPAVSGAATALHLPSLTQQVETFTHIARSTRLSLICDIDNHVERALTLTQRSKEASLSNTILCDDFGNVFQTLRVLIEYVSQQWISFDPGQHVVHVARELNWRGEHPSALRLRDGSERGFSYTLPNEEDVVHYFQAGPAIKRPFGPYLCRIEDAPPGESNRFRSVAECRGIADKQNCILGICEPLWFLAYYPRYLLKMKEEFRAHPGIEFGDLTTSDGRKAPHVWIDELRRNQHLLRFGVFDSIQSSPYFGSFIAKIIKPEGLMISCPNLEYAGLS